MGTLIFLPFQLPKTQTFDGSDREREWKLTISGRKVGRAGREWKLPSFSQALGPWVYSRLGVDRDVTWTWTFDGM